jgi:hypothetical protein
MKIVINACHGGFSLSEEAQKLFCQYSMIEWKDWQEDWSYYDIERNNQHLVRVVEELGDSANGRFAELKVVDIPDEVEWQIDEYDGAEWVAEKHRTWR